jgi:hypothetical protein
MKLRKIISQKDLWDVVINDNLLFYRQSFEYKNTTYFFCSDGYKNWQITEEEFLKAKFGLNYQLILETIQNDMAVARHIDEYQYYCSFYSNTFWKFNTTGEKEDEFKIDNLEDIYGFDIDPSGYLWLAFPTADYVAKYSVKQGKEVKHIGIPHSDQSELSMPEDLIIYNNILFLADTGNKRVLVYDINNEKIISSILFDQMVWQFLIFRSEGIVRLETGIFAFDLKKFYIQSLLSQLEKISLNNIG